MYIQHTTILITIFINFYESSQCDLHFINFDSISHILYNSITTLYTVILNSDPLIVTKIFLNLLRLATMNYSLTVFAVS